MPEGQTTESKKWENKQKRATPAVTAIRPLTRGYSSQRTRTAGYVHTHLFLHREKVLKQVGRQARKGSERRGV